MPNPTRPQIREALRTLVADKRYWDHAHPEHDAYVAHVTGEFKRVYPGKYEPGSAHMYANDPQGGPEAIVHVRAYSQSRGGNVVEVSDYDRAAPGAGAVLNRKYKASTVQGTKSPIPKPIIREDDSGSGEFGTRRKTVDGKIHPHTGVDIEAAPGTAVTSPVDGTVQIRKAYKHGEYNDEFTNVWVNDGKGNEVGLFYVTPKDASGKPVVKNGDKVKAGEPVGTVQDRAKYDPNKQMHNHVHVEIKQNGENVDPTKTIREWQNQ